MSFKYGSDNAVVGPYTAGQKVKGLACVSATGNAMRNSCLDEQKYVILDKSPATEL